MGKGRLDAIDLTFNVALEEVGGEARPAYFDRPSCPKGPAMHFGDR